MEVQPVLFHVWPQSWHILCYLPVTGEKGDRECRNAGSEARRCCRAGEEEGQLLSAAGSVFQRAG